MPGTYSKILLHFVFATKDRNNLITPDLEPRLHQYLGGLIRGEGSALWSIGGMPDHLHLLVQLAHDRSAAEVMRVAKGRSSRWVHETFPDKQQFAWQENYGVFSVSPSQVDVVKMYIERQKEHHAKRNAKDELAALLRAHGIEFDDRYL